MKKFMNIRCASAVLLCGLLLFAGCGQQGKQMETAESETLPETEKSTDTEGREGRFSAEGTAFLSSLDGYNIIKWAEEEMDGSWTELFEAYDGSQLQRVRMTEDDNYSPAVCPDVIFYRPEQGEAFEAIVKKMVDAMIQPLTKPSDTRLFTITDYKIVDQELIPLEDHVWILPAIDGYYSYEGVDLISMDEYTAMEPDLEKDGMMPFMKQAEDGEFVLFLMELDGVYRLQRMQGMISGYDFCVIQKGICPAANRYLFCADLSGGYTVRRSK